MISKLKENLLGHSKSDFFRNVSKLITGTAISQLILLATTPILYRIYEKEDFGLVALYLSISTIISSFAALQYPQSLLLDEDDDNIFQLLFLTTSINLILTIVVLTTVMIGGKQIANLLNSPHLCNWLILLPISFFASGQTEVLRNLANRQKKYGAMSWNSMFTSLSLSIISIFIGLQYKGPLGLFLGMLASQVLPSFYLGYVLTSNNAFSSHKISMLKVKKLAVKYINLPKYLLPTVLINQINSQLPVWILSTLVGPAVVGTYSLTIRVLALPSQLISNAVGEVYKQRAQEHYVLLGNFRDTFISTFKVLLGLSIIPSTFIILFGPHLFAFLFGEKWREAGVYSQIMAILFLCKFIVSPLSYAYYIKTKHREDMYLHVVLLLGTILTLYYGFVITESTSIALLMYSISYSFIYGIYLFRSYKLSGS